MQLYHSAVLAIVLMVLVIQQSHGGDYLVTLAFNHAFTQDQGQHSDFSCVDPGRITETGQALCKTIGKGLKNATGVSFGRGISNLYISCKGGEASIYDCPTAQMSFCTYGMKLFCE